jgi:hypothetical protein
MDRLGLSVSGTEDYCHFTDRYYSSDEFAQKLNNRKCKYTFGFFYIYALVEPTFGQNTSLSGSSGI